MKCFIIILLILVSITSAFSNFNDSVVIDTSLIEGEQIIVKKYYILGDISKEEQFYFNGSVRLVRYYRNGKLDGIIKVWNKEGILIEELNIDIGIINGEWKQWYDNGNIKMKGTYINGKGVVDYFNLDGKRISQITVNQNGEYIGDCFYWCENGQLIYHTNFLDTLKVFTSFYCNGKKKEEGKIYKGWYRVNQWKEWYENGMIKAKGSYIKPEDVKMYVHFQMKKDKEWKYYSNEGKLIKKEVYEKGNLIQVIKYEK